MKIEVTGTAEMEALLTQIAPKHARNIMRATVHGIATEVRKDVRKNAPVGDTGTIKKAVKAKRRRSPPDKPASTVEFTTGKGATHDAYYWRFHEYGTVKMPASPFVAPAKERAETPACVRQRPAPDPRETKPPCSSPTEDRAPRKGRLPPPP